MRKKLEQLREKAFSELQATKNRHEAEEFRHRILGRKGELTAMLKNIKDLSVEEKKTVGKLANDLKKDLEEGFNAHLLALEQHQRQKIGKDFFDTSLPGSLTPQGRLHPITKFIQEVEETFTALNFDIAEGPEVEDDYHNFSALNVPPDHPARDTQDTLWIKDIPYLLRTQTSSVQIRHMEKNTPPIRVVSPGRVYRNDEMDATHSPIFHQFEGLMVDTTTNLSNLKGILTVALRRLIHPELNIRFRNSFFPFVEPGLEADVTCVLCNGKGCSLCKQSGWVEMLGCGMVHPNVLRSSGIDPEKYQGFAFGAGIERLLMIKYSIRDIRLLYQNDPRFLEQFPLLS